MDTAARNEQIAAHYDAQPYDSNAFYYSSPAHLRAAAYLYGIDTPPVANARVLELGCAAGGNLLPFACMYPNATAVGVDLSEVQVNQGKELIERMGLTNLQLHAMSITDITPEFGTFDYIIVHGVFSWVPPEVRDAILRVCKENLSEQGVAYISYNCYPGWKSGEIVRDAMLFHSHFVPEEDKVASAKAMLTLLSDGLAAGNPLRPSLLGAVAQLRKHNDYYIAHEYLETFNNPCYFVEFADAAAQAGLTHVGDSEPRLEMAANFGGNVQLNHSLIAIGQNRLMRQQYLDFAVGRNFRKSMLVSAEREADIATSPDLNRLADLYFAGRFTPVKAEDQVADTVRVFLDHRGNRISYDNAAMIAVLEQLNTLWPRAVSGQDLIKIATEHGEDQPQRILDRLFYLGRHYMAQEADDIPAALTTSTESKQLIDGALDVLRWRREVAPGIGQFNPWHDGANMQLSDPEWFVVQLLPTMSKPAELRKALIDAWQLGRVVDKDGSSLKGHRNLEAKADTLIKDLFALLVRQGVLV